MSILSKKIIFLSLCVFYLWSIFDYVIFWIRLRDVQLKQQQKNHKNDASLSYNKINHTDEISPVDNDEIKNWNKYFK